MSLLIILLHNSIGTVDRQIENVIQLYKYLCHHNYDERNDDELQIIFMRSLWHRASNQTK